MNRPIKFRAWDVGTKQMVPWEDFYEIPYLLKNFHGHIKDETQIFMQFTGAKDKNGVEIYEGDIMKSEKGIKWRVYYSPERCAFAVKTKNVWKPAIGETIRKSMRFAIEKLVVIGNAYEGRSEA